MSELLDKLSRRRTIVEEDGAHFENAPAGQASTVGASSSPKLERSQTSPQAGTTGRRFSGGGEDFTSAMSRRRAMVDDDAETFESKPAEKVADVAAEYSFSAASAPRNSAPSAPGRRSGVDFRTAIGQQRVSVDGAGLHFESKPQANTADCVSGTPQPQPPAVGASAPAGAAPAAEPREAPEPQAAAPAVGGQPVEEPAPAQVPQAAEEEAAAGDAPSEEPKAEPAEAAASVPTPSRAPAPQPTQEEPAAEEQEVVVEEGEDEDEGEQEAAQEASSNFRTEVTVRKDRITWLVGLQGASPQPGGFVSDPFSIGSYGPVTLRLRPEASGCVLSLQGEGAGPRPRNLRVGLFAGKGWAKRSLTAWPDGADLEERFETSFAGRASLLCGLVHQGAP